jgi:hypothetical protein
MQILTATFCRLHGTLEMLVDLRVPPAGEIPWCKLSYRGGEGSGGEVLLAKRKVKFCLR